MLETRPRFVASPPTRRRSTRLWILCALLGAGTTYFTVATIHDSSQRQMAVQLAATAAAERVATHAGTLLDVLALTTFAPAQPWAFPSPRPGDILERLLEWQRDGERCRCRDILGATAFFVFDPRTDSLRVALAGKPLQSALANVSTLQAIAREESARAAGWRRGRSHIVAGPAPHEWAAVMVTQSDSTGKTVAVYGLLAPARQTLQSLFGPDAAGRGGARGPVHSELDSLALAIGTGDSMPLLGRIGEGRIAATIRPQGPLEGLTLTAGLTTDFVVSVHPDETRRRQFWSLGALFACTILVAGFAVSSLRREAQLAQARSDFIAGVSHDLRMPLAQVLLASETLTQGRARDDSERATLLTSILREARRLAALVENVIFISRTGQTALQPQLGAVPVEELFADVVEAIELAVEDAGQRIVVSAEAAPPATGDARLLRQALVNLVDNALKYGSAGQTIRLDARTRGRSLVQLAVSDEGPGVPAAFRSRVFHPYERLPRDQASERTGTGLGLAVVRQIAEACGGRVWLEGGPRGGTVAVIELPVHGAAS